MRKNYTLFVFSNGTLIHAQSPSHCLFDTPLSSLPGKRIDEILISLSVDQIAKLEPNHKTFLNLCAKSTGSLFRASVIRTKFQKAETVLVYVNENMDHTNSADSTARKKSILETMLMEENQKIYQLIDELKTTRNLQQIKHLKAAFSTLYQKIDDCVEKIVKANPIEKYHQETFPFSLTVRNYLDQYEAAHPDNIWITYHEFKSAFVLGSREKLIDLLDSFFNPYKNVPNTKIIVHLTQENDLAIADFTVLLPNCDAEFSRELTDFSFDEKKLLAKHAGCEVKTYYLPGQGYKMTVSYDSYAGYKLYEPEDETERIAPYEKDAQLLTTGD